MNIIEKELEAKKAWEHYVENNELPTGIPANPDEIYKDEWKGWAYFLGWVGFEMN